MFDGHVVRALRPRARYFSVRPSYSVNKCNILFSEIKKQMQEKNQRFCEHHLYARSNVPMAPRVFTSGYVSTDAPRSCYESRVCLTTFTVLHSYSDGWKHKNLIGNSGNRLGCIVVHESF